MQQKPKSWPMQKLFSPGFPQVVNQRMHLVYPVLQVVKLLLQLSPGWLNSTKSKMNKPFQVNRRDFLKTGAFIGGGLLISFAIPTVIKRLASTTLSESPVAMNAFLRIGEDDSIYIILSKVEMWQCS